MLFSRAYLRSLWEGDYRSFKDSTEAQELYKRLKNWASRLRQKETEAESAFIDLFFKQTWDYHASGERSGEEAFTLWPQFPVKGAGAGGGTGKADIALGYFPKSKASPIPQVLGEFKDDRSGLDTPQKGRKNDRSPVQQCFDYLREARSGLKSTVLPTWGIVTDMNEFRLYIYGNRTEYQRFFIDEAPGGKISLVDDSEAAAFERFLFYRMFHRQWLLSDIGKSKLQQLLDGQLVYEQSLENDFYAEYHAYREAVFQALQEHNPSYRSNEELFKLVKFTQQFLDRIIFVLYCEDMGQMLDFPPNILRDILIEVSSSRFYDPNGGEAWFRIKELFRAMGEGLPFGGHAINRFNGGLFADDAEMNALHFPNALFCVQGQAESEARILEHPKTLLYFSAKYNFGEDESGEGRSLSLTAMGRIFEQSITDLEVMEAHAQGRESLVELTKRKRDGVYYTPEWVTRYIVENTIGSRLAEIRKELGFDAFTGITDEQIAEHHADKRKHKVVAKYADALYRYSERLNAFKVVDPACGSGAFLVQAFRYLYEQRKWVAQERRRVDAEASLFDVDATIRDILSENIYGVDINAESVEITKLTLWLNTAAKDKPLTKLDDNIRCGNSLVGTDFYAQLGIDEGSFPELKKERVNPFDWHSAFPEVFERESSGFDAVVGNPPYVKLQHFRRIDEETATYLLQAVAEDGSPLYESTQSGNFDLYLPFIEKGISLLNEEGKMGYIAPNLWLLNDYGKALRQRVKRQRNLERWIDFKSYQVFSDAITYTALQFFTAHPNETIRCAFAPKGREEVEMVNWDEVEDTIGYDELPEEQSWVFVTRREKALIDKLAQTCRRLDKAADKIIVGIQTSADYIYHLKRLAHGRYLHKPKKSKEWEEVALEDAVMRPLVSGPEAKRYLEPKTETWLLFPYELTEDGPNLIDAGTFERRYPLAWAYLKQYENDLRDRENGKMDIDDGWWGYNYPKNLDKQELKKLIVAQTVPEMRVCYDANGEFYLNNVRVNGILPHDESTGWMLLGILNAPVCNFVFKRIAKVKAGGYYEANKQFIAPLPIPEVHEVQKAQVIELAKALQSLHTERRDKIDAIDKRLASTQCEEEAKGYEWFWAEVKPVSEFKKVAPNELTRREKTAWAKEKHEQLLKTKLGVIDALLKPGVKLEALFDDGELTLSIDGIPTLHLYLDDEEGRFVAAQWCQKIRQTNITEKFDAKKLIKLLLSLKRTENTALREQILRLDEEIADIETKIDEKEDAMNRLVYGLYGLEEEDIALIEQMEGASWQ
jgi:hypothetical protein